MQVFFCINTLLSYLLKKNSHSPNCSVIETTLRLDLHKKTKMRLLKGCLATLVVIIGIGFLLFYGTLGALFVNQALENQVESDIKNGVYTSEEVDSLKAVKKEKYKKLANKVNELSDYLSESNK